MTTQWIYSKAPTASAGSATKKIKNEMRKKNQKAQEKQREREREGGNSELYGLEGNCK